MIRTRTLSDGSKVYRVRVGNGPQRSFTKHDDALEYEGNQKRNRARVRSGFESTEIVDTTFEELCKLWVSNNAPSEWKLYILAHSRTKWGQHTLSALRPEQIGAWLHGLDLAGKTKSEILSTLRAVLDAAVEWGYLARNPARSRAIKSPSKKRQSPILPFESWEEVLEMAKATASFGEDVSSPFIRFACATGVRCPGELMAVTWEHVDRKTGMLDVQGTKSEAARRLIPLSENALAALDDLPRSIHSTDPVWRNRHGRTLIYLNWRDTDWRKGLTELGLAHREPYQMRHTFATLALAAGAPIDDVASMMGHEDINIVWRYYRKWMPRGAERLRVVLNTIGKENDGSATGVQDHRRGPGR
jgi:integrase